jgi:ATP adenylyltransferase
MNDPFPKTHLESLWAPWRVEYFQAEHQAGTDFLSEAAQTNDDAAHLVVTRRKSTFLLMNKYPYSAGHLMAVTYRKVSEMTELTDDEVLELWHLCVHAQLLLKECVKAQGFNIGWNLGKAAGAGVHDHLHLHIVPRWVGDANFMTVLGDTRIIPEGLQPLYARLKAAQDLIAGAA